MFLVYDKENKRESMTFYKERIGIKSLDCDNQMLWSLQQADENVARASNCLSCRVKKEEWCRAMLWN